MPIVSATETETEGVRVIKPSVRLIFTGASLPRQTLAEILLEGAEDGYFSLTLWQLYHLQNVIAGDTRLISEIRLQLQSSVNSKRISTWLQINLGDAGVSWDWGIRS